MNDNLCTYKIKKGKQSDTFCCKKITKNGNKKEFVCTKHNSKHIPKKRIPKNKQLNIITNINNEHNTKKNHNYKKPLLNIKRDDQKKIYKRNKTIKPKKIVIKGIINFKDIFKNLLL